MLLKSSIPQYLLDDQMLTVIYRELGIGHWELGIVILLLPLCPSAPPLTTPHSPLTIYGRISGLDSLPARLTEFNFLADVSKAGCCILAISPTVIVSFCAAKVSRWLIR